VYVSPDNRSLLTANQGTEEQPSTTVSIIDTETYTVTKSVETGKGAHGVVVDPSSTHAYITNIYGDDVAVIDLAQGEVVATIPSDDAPNGISFSPLMADQPIEPTIELPIPHDEEDEDMSEMTH
jgi:YVTN family beta-propeller protein